MELDGFVKTVLSQVISGIREAQDVEGVGAFVVPAGIGGHTYAKHDRVSNFSGGLTSTIIDFDIAVTAEDTATTSGGGGLKVVGIGASLEGSSTSKDTKISRIQFAVPILLPESRTKWHEELKKE
ncbi:MAG: hypothetical protein PsegKO_20830 [Pseudohongiellaceae bacterium]